MLTLLVIHASAFVFPLANGKPQNYGPSPVNMKGGINNDFVADLQRRTIMNAILLGGAALPVGWLGGGSVSYTHLTLPTKA